MNHERMTIPRYYECQDCGNRLTAASFRAACSDCGGQLRNIAVARE